MTTFSSFDAGGISRRNLLVGAASTALILPAGFAQTAPPKRGGTLRIAATGASAGDSLDPSTFNSPYMVTVGHTYGNCLVELKGEANEMIPELAESWEYADGGRRWIFNLRKGVTFHDGRPFTAKDVVWTLNYHGGPNSKSGSKALLADMTSVKADGSHRVIVELSSPNLDFPYILTGFQLIILPENTTQFNGIGTGPYKVVKFVPGQRLEASRYANYWKQGRAHVDKVELLAINDTAARLNAIQSGQVHIVEGLDPKTAGLLERVPNVRVARVPSTLFSMFNMLCDVAPFNNADLRMALKLSLDREDLVKRVYRGYARVGNDHPVVATHPFFNASLPQRKYDPEQAKHYFKKSGFSGSLPLHTSDAVGATAIEAASLFKEHAAKAGITIDIQREPADGYWSNVWSKKAFHASIWFPRATPDIIMSTAFKGGSTWNDTHWKNDQFDKALVAARGETDPAKRKELYGQCQAILHQDGGALIPAFLDLLDGVRSNVQGFEPSLTTLSGLRAAERCWLT
ncbi:MAG: ABC transporter substrate-binding protein [Polaromonas sp.]